MPKGYEVIGDLLIVKRQRLAVRYEQLSAEWQGHNAKLGSVQHAHPKLGSATHLLVLMSHSRQFVLGRCSFYNRDAILSYRVRLRACIFACCSLGFCDRDEAC